ncbi:MAG: radical SAM protein [Verrucomicrobiales bacterium]|nr:radical SAM protein [Verrucomicrobiales bacterium]
MIAKENCLKETKSICPVCRGSVPAKVYSRDDEVWMRKECPQCGEADTRISTDARFYWLSTGAREEKSGNCCDSSCGCATPVSGNYVGFLGQNAIRPIPKTDPIEVMSTCLALIEIVDSCNLACPTCFADSPKGAGDDVDATPLEELKIRIQDVIDRKGPIEILQLSGGEPTLHPHFFELVQWCQQNEGIDYLLVNSNGVRLAGDKNFGEQLARVMEYGHFQFYLQFDGTNEAADLSLRGSDLRLMKRKAIERAGELGIPLTLAMTVIPENVNELWNTVKYGLQFDHVRGVAFQPMFGSGRVHSVSSQNHKLNVADIILGLVDQSGGTVGFEDFTPLPCGDPNCATIGYLLKMDGEIRSISEFVDFATLQGFLSDRVRYRLEDLIKCGCESEPLGELLHELEMDERNTFRLFIKPFMDERDWDQDRIDRCCTHVIRPDGKLDSFCRYYLNGGAKAYRTPK